MGFGESGSQNKQQQAQPETRTQLRTSNPTMSASTRGIFFCGDDRDPKKIFTKGGFQRKGGKGNHPVQIRFHAEGSAPDVSSAVAFTRDFTVAPLFPLPLQKKKDGNWEYKRESWVYILDIDVQSDKYVDGGWISGSGFVHTQEIQHAYISKEGTWNEKREEIRGKYTFSCNDFYAIDATKKGPLVTKQNEETANKQLVSTMFAQEAAAPKVTTEEIVGAVKVSRIFNNCGASACFGVATSQ